MIAGDFNARTGEEGDGMIRREQKKRRREGNEGLRTR